MAAVPESARTIRLGRPVNLGLTLGPIQHGRADPTVSIGTQGVWRATRTPEGPATTHLQTLAGLGEVTVRAWGPGGAWALEAAPTLLGADDDDEGFDPAHPVLAYLYRRLVGLRMARTGAVMEALTPNILEQKVVGREAKRSYARLVRALGEPAPGPVALRLPPAPARLAATPSWVFHRAGVERRRGDTVRVAASYAPRLEEVVGLSRPEAYRRLTALPGIGPWTAAEVGLVALGDADAVPVGDYHLPDQVAWALAGEERADDARMLDLLEPYRGQRGRVVRLIRAGARTPPRYGPRMALRSIAEL